MAFLFGIALPALAVVQQAIDPTSFATICRVDTGAASDPAAPDAPQDKFKSAHCLMCVSTASPPPVSAAAPVVVSTVPELLPPVDRSPLVAGDPAALQPQNPRAPPRV
ncbi:MAG: hypothetical protein RJA24_127 [Pseudomonadota bacterium]